MGEGLTQTLHENMRALVENRRKAERARTVHERIADRISRWAGTMQFAYAHAVFFALWLVWNAIEGLPRWDPPPYVGLAMFASVEAIFLSTFVLVSQNRMAKLADRRADLDVQINLLAEREVTRVLAIVSEIAHRLAVDVEPPDVDDLKQDVDPGAILDQITDIDDAEKEAPRGSEPRRRARAS
jgi:uncharacterized membrane protein